MEIAVLSVKPPYNFTADDGRQISGFKVVFSQIGMKKDDEEKTLGPVLVDKAFSDLSLRNFFQIGQVPGVYDMDITQAYSGKGKVREVVRSFKYLRPVKIEDLQIK